MSVYGFDFGTTNSLISRVEGDRCIVFDDNGMPHPSVLCYEGDRVLVGKEARDRMVSPKIGVMGNIVRSPKMFLGRHSVHVEGVARSPREMVSQIVSYMISEAKKKHPGDFSRAVVTIPVDMTGEKRRDLREAFRLAGVTIDQFVHEPLAALYAYLRSMPDYQSELRRLDRQYMLVFDWGGGTLDLTLCQLTDGLLVQIRNDGCSNIGGDSVDEAIQNEVVRRFLAHHGVSEELEPAAGAESRLLSRAERAKIELSSKEQYPIYVPNYFQTDGDADIDYELTRSELDDIVREKIEAGTKRVIDLLRRAGLQPADIALCLATGGMVNMPAINTRLYEMFGPQRVRVSERGQTIISEGAAWIAHDRANLRLAKNLEVALARGARHPVIRAGLEMPREGLVKEGHTLQLYCTDPRDGLAKIQLESPIRHGRDVQRTDPRDTMAVLSVEVDKHARKLFERVDLRLAIDEDLVLKVVAKSALKGDLDEQEIHDLEFGLWLVGEEGPGKPGGGGSVSSDNEPEPENGAVGREEASGAVELRANVALTEDYTQVPGDCLYALKPRLMDRGRGATDLQVDEHLYYQPCSICQRLSHDPMCRCASASQ